MSTTSILRTRGWCKKCNHCMKRDAKCQTNLIAKSNVQFNLNYKLKCGCTPKDSVCFIHILPLALHLGCRRAYSPNVKQAANKERFSFSQPWGTWHLCFFNVTLSILLGLFNRLSTSVHIANQQSPWFKKKTIELTKNKKCFSWS